MTTDEIREWLARAEGSDFRWTEDESFRNEGSGRRYYRGGDEGKYIEVLPDGRMEIGNYTDGHPNIFNDPCAPVVRKRYSDILAAFVKAVEFTGGQLISDLIGLPAQGMALLLPHLHRTNFYCPLTVMMDDHDGQKHVVLHRPWTKGATSNCSPGCSSI